MQSEDILSLPFRLHFLDGIIVKRASVYQLLGCSDAQYIQERQGEKLHSFPFSQVLEK